MISDTPGEPTSIIGLLATINKKCDQIIVQNDKEIQLLEIKKTSGARK